MTERFYLKWEEILKNCQIQNYINNGINDIILYVAILLNVTRMKLLKLKIQTLI